MFDLKLKKNSDLSLKDLHKSLISPTRAWAIIIITSVTTILLVALIVSYMSIRIISGSIFDGSPETEVGQRIIDLDQLDQAVEIIKGRNN